MSAEPEILIEPSAEELAAAVAARTVATLIAAQGQRPLAHLVVTGGSILESVFAEIRTAPRHADLDWTRVALWWGDERFVAADSDDRNDKAAFGLLFDHVPLKAENIHRMPSTDGVWGEDVDAGVAAYQAELAGAAGPGATDGLPHFDVVLLGVGPDGHCASLFPRAAGVHEVDAAVIAVLNSPKPPPTRTSLTFKGLGAADEVWVIASGSGKAKAVSQALGGADRVDVPSAGARGRHRTIWLLDTDAAAELPQR